VCSLVSLHRISLFAVYKSRKLGQHVQVSDAAADTNRQQAEEDPSNEV